MNKRSSHTLRLTLAGASLAASAFTGAAHAQSAIDPHWYLGGGLGHVYADPNKADYADLRPGATNSTTQDDSTAWKLYGGLQLTPNWGLELGYADLGQYHNNYSLPAGDQGQSTNKLSAWSLAGTGTWPINQQFSLHAKAGLALVSSNYTFSGGGGYPTGDNGSNLSATPTVGVGAMYHINPHVALRVDYDAYGKVGNPTGNLTTTGATGDARPSMVSAGVQYNF
jgi:OOP family OmpA-OmpF porin